jgi:hypothetical protein
VGGSYVTYRGNCAHVMVGEVKEGDYLKDLGVDGIIILKCILRNEIEGHGIDLCGSEYWQAAGCCGRSTSRKLRIS